MLALTHHGTVELVDRVQAHGHVVRLPDEQDRRVVRVRLAPAGERLLRDLGDHHREQRRRIRALVDAEDAPANS